MRYILFVGHGSREEAGNEEVRAFVRGMTKNRKKKYPNTEVCFIEFGSPDISTGIDICLNGGANEIVVVPIILLPAGHSKIDIPQAIDAGKAKYPHVKFYYSAPVGSDVSVLEILQQRMEQVWKSSDRILQQNTPQNTGATAVLLLGRGSSDADANSTLMRISRLFWELLQSHNAYEKNIQLVETAFMGVTQPLMKDGLDRCRLLGAKHIIILPYFLFTGVLMQRMKKTAEEYGLEFPDIKVQLADYFGFHPLLEDIVERRIDEAANGQARLNCDMCKYRIQSHTENHHEHIRHHDGHHQQGGAYG